VSNKTVTAETFDDSRARTYRKGALVVGSLSNDPAIYLKGGWSSKLDYVSGTPLDADTAQAVKDRLTEAGFDGAQIMPGAHFAMCDTPGNVYGCAPGGVEQSEGKEPNPDQPLAYAQALTDKSIEAATAALVVFNGLDETQAGEVAQALSFVRAKPAFARAYQVTETDGPTRIITKIDGKVESDVVAQPGDWVVKQANGEVMRIGKDKFFDKIRYVEVVGE